MAALLCIMDMCPHLAEIAHVERGSTDRAIPEMIGSLFLRARWPKCRCCQEGSFILQIEHIPLAVDYLSVLGDRHVDAGTAFSIDQFDSLRQGYFTAVIPASRTGGPSRPAAGPVGVFRLPVLEYE